MLIIVSIRRHIAWRMNSIAYTKMPQTMMNNAISNDNIRNVHINIMNLSSSFLSYTKSSKASEAAHCNQQSHKGHKRRNHGIP